MINIYSTLSPTIQFPGPNLSLSGFQGPICHYPVSRAQSVTIQFPGPNLSLTFAGFEIRCKFVALWTLASVAPDGVHTMASATQRGVSRTFIDVCNTETSHTLLLAVEEHINRIFQRHVESPFPSFHTHSVHSRFF